MHRIQYHGWSRMVPGDIDLTEGQKSAYHMLVQSCGYAELDEIEESTLRAIVMARNIVPYDVSCLLEHVREAEGAATGPRGPWDMTEEAVLRYEALQEYCSDLVLEESDRRALRALAAANGTICDACDLFSKLRRSGSEASEC